MIATLTDHLANEGNNVIECSKAKINRNSTGFLIRLHKNNIKETRGNSYP